MCIIHIRFNEGWIHNENFNRKEEKDMKKIFKTSIAFISLMFAANISMAQNDWTGAAAGNDNITDGGNWQSGVPDSSGNLGEIETGATVELNSDLNGYFVQQNDGSVSESTTTNRRFTDGSWSMSGGTFTMDSNLELRGSQTFTLSDGTVNLNSGRFDPAGTVVTITGGSLTANNMFTGGGSSQITISGGTHLFTVTPNASAVRLRGSGNELTISGGTVTLNSEFRTEGTFFMNGGDFSTTSFNVDAGSQWVMGGSTAGTIDAGEFRELTEDNVDLNWLSGSLIEMTVGEGDISGENWAQYLWNSDRMKFNGQTSTDLGQNWSQVEGSIFTFDPGTETLALIPEPSSIALLGLAGLAVYFFRRRK